MQRLTGEDGAVAVLVAVTLVVMLGLSALVLDVGNLYWERRQLQNGADAAALAAAQDIVDGSGATALATARQYADSNNSRGAFIAGSDLVVGPNSVTVTTQTGSAAGPGELTSIFAGVLGVDAYETSATATASWGALGAADTLPLTFSYCEWEVFTGLEAGATAAEIAAALPTGTRVVYHHTNSASDLNACAGPAGQNAPGGFGWLDEEGPCAAFVENGAVGGDTGASMSQACRAEFADRLGQIVTLPIFFEVTGTGGNAVYHIGGFAALEFQGYRFPGEASSPAPCGPPNTCISGRFVEYYDLGGAPTAPGGIEFGAYVIGLTG